MGEDAAAAVRRNVDDGSLVVQPATPTALTLEDLLAGVSEERLHPSIDTGEAVGPERCWLRLSRPDTPAPPNGRDGCASRAPP